MFMMRQVEAGCLEENKCKFENESGQVSDYDLAGGNSDEGTGVGTGGNQGTILNYNVTFLKARKHPCIAQLSERLFI